MKFWQPFKEWFINLGDKYGVDPIIFGSIYLSAIPFFTLSIGWLVYNYRKGKSIVFPILSAGFFFISAYLYLFIVGENIPWWVYLMLIAMIAYGGWSTYNGARKKIAKTDEKNDPEGTKE